MIKEIEVRVPPHDSNYLNSDILNYYQSLAAKKFGIDPIRITHIALKKRSIDARKKLPVYVLRFLIWIDELYQPMQKFIPKLQDVNKCIPAIVVGFGPAGIFAALKLIELGIKPIIIERGKTIRARRRDIAAISKHGLVNTESNYCFGEGGAGTFSDGKLYTRSNKRGSIERILNILNYFGASNNILLDAHPHIGTNKLPQVIEAARDAIIESGGEIHFTNRLDELIISTNSLRGIVAKNTVSQDQLSLYCHGLILATGHSARDVFRLLDHHKLSLEAKDFAVGLRVEHPQTLIDQIQYNCTTRDRYLPAASYALQHQVNGSGVFSFCMCPGGIICPAATANDEVVVNGWSPSKRNSAHANSGIVVQLPISTLAHLSSSPIFAGVEFQASLEHAAYQAGGGKQVAPAQRLLDFVNGNLSKDLPPCSYLPGIKSVNLSEILPENIYYFLSEGFKSFGKQRKGYLTNEAIVVGVETRTSSPIRIPRETETLMHTDCQGLFPCGEGAGYAGGIMSAAMDGERVAEALAKFYHQEGLIRLNLS